MRTLARKHSHTQRHEHRKALCARDQAKAALLCTQSFSQHPLPSSLASRAASTDSLPLTLSRSFRVNPRESESQRLTDGSRRRDNNRSSLLHDACLFTHFLKEEARRGREMEKEKLNESEVSFSSSSLRLASPSLLLLLLLRTSVAAATHARALAPLCSSDCRLSLSLSLFLMSCVDAATAVALSQAEETRKQGNDKCKCDLDQVAF